MCSLGERVPWPLHDHKVYPSPKPANLEQAAPQRDGVRPQPVAGEGFAKDTATQGRGFCNIVSIQKRSGNDRTRQPVRYGTLKNVCRT